MRFIPDKKLDIISDEDFPTAIKSIEEKLDNCRISGFFDTADNKKIYYEYFLAENSKASIVIVHGLSEFTKKFYEITFYFLNQGYNVFLYDQRCHGLSCRLTDRIDLIHVDDFDDYASDLSTFIDTVVSPADSKPIYLYSHSMGGAVVAMYLARDCGKVEKAVMSAPLIEPRLGNVSPWIARVSVILGSLFYGSKTKFKFSSEFNPERPYKTTTDATENRFLHHMKLRRGDPHYQSTPLTYGWVRGSLALRSRLLKKQVTDSITTPTLLLSAEKDTVVRLDAQHEFAKRCGACTLVTVKGGNHSMFAGEEDVLSGYLKTVLDFYA